MSRDRESLIDIINSIKRILRYANGINRFELETNDEKLSAILYQVTIIGEATKRLSESLRQNHSEIPWREMAGMRDIIVHKYDQYFSNCSILSSPKSIGYETRQRNAPTNIMFGIGVLE